MKRNILVMALIVGSASVSFAQQISYGGIGGLPLGETGLKLNSYGGIQITPSPSSYTSDYSSDRHKTSTATSSSSPSNQGAALSPLGQRMEQEKQAKDRLKQEAAVKVRHVESKEISVPASWNGVTIAERVEVILPSGKVYAFNDQGEIASGGFSVVPQSDKTKWIRPEWSADKNNVQRCYARLTNKKLAFGGLPVHEDICKAVHPSIYGFAKAGDGKLHCYEGTVMGSVVNGGLPVHDKYCDSKKVVESHAAIGYFTSFIIDRFYPVVFKACIKGAKESLSPIVLPAEKCPGFNLNNTVFKKIKLTVLPELAEVAKILKAPATKEVCTLVDAQSNMLVGMQFDDSKCK